MSADEAKQILTDAQDRYLYSEEVWRMLQRQIDRIDGEGV
jgi:hypothetical protein